jgi:hypothetical protein
MPERVLGDRPIKPSLATLHPCSIELDICVEILHGEAEE